MTAQSVPDQELDRLTPSGTEDHLKLAEQYAAHAADHEAEARAHEALAEHYEKTSPALASGARDHAVHSREAARALRGLSAQHREAAI